jgi:phosphoribosylformylglycinamidine cyclo-ligase
MVAIVGADSADLTIKALAARGMQAWVAGSVSATTPGAARSALEGGYRKR